MEYIKIIKFVFTTNITSLGVTYPVKWIYGFDNQDGFAMDSYSEKISDYLDNLPGLTSEIIEGEFIMDDIAFNTFFARINSDPDIIVDFITNIRNEAY